MAERQLFAHEIEARLDELLLVRLRQRPVADIVARIEALPRPRQERLLHWVGVAAQGAGELGWLVAAQGAAHAAALGDRLDDWVRGGLAAHDRGGIAAAAVALADVAPPPPAGAVDLAAVQGRLARFVQAYHGRPARLAAGTPARTDGATLWLPQRLDRHADAGANRGLYLVLVALLCARLNDDGPDLEAEPEFAAWPDRDAALAWFSLFEAMRLEARLTVELPGLAREVRAQRGPWPASLAAAAALLARAGSSAADSLALVAERRRVGAGDAPSYPHVPRADPSAARPRPAAAVASPARPLRGLLRALDGQARGGGADPEHAPLVAQDQAHSATAGADAGSPLPADAAVDAGRREPPLAPEPTQAAGPGAWRPVSGGDAAPAAEPDDTPDAVYDEWDYRRAAWRTAWCHLYETEGPAGEDAWVESVRRRHARLIRDVRRRFEALRGEDKAERRQPEGGEIDLDALVDARADRRRGSEVSPRLFIQRRRVERSLAVMFMVDMSGSTKGWVNDAEREALVLLCEAIGALGDRYAIYGFSGWTHRRCDIYRIKSFADDYDAATRRRIAGIEARDYTRMGVAVRHLSGLLRREPARHKLLVTLSDGRPDDHGDEYRGRYGIEDTRRALLEAREQGIRSYCVTIDRHGADYLPQLYGPAHYSVIDDARKLPRKLAEIYRKLTA